MHVAEFLVGILAANAAASAVFAAALAFFGMHRIDSVGEPAPLGFRLIVMPEAAAPWPLLPARWINSTRS